jgi:hypothetical protein
MAPKRPQLKLTQRTESAEPAAQATAHAGAPTGNELPATGRTRAIGIGLKESKYDGLGQIAEATGIARNSLGRYATRDFIKRYRRGEIDLSGKIDEPPPPKKRLRMD